MTEAAQGRKIALVTNVHGYAGEGAVLGLSGGGFSVFAHDPDFADAGARDAFAKRFPGAEALAEQEPEAIAARLIADHGRIDAVISNDPVKSVLKPFAEFDAEDYRAMAERAMIWPFRLAQAVLPGMKAQRSGAIIFITSAVAHTPMPHSPLYCAVRAGTTALAISLGQQVGPFNIQINAIGPNWFENPTYFVPGEWEKRPGAAEKLASEVPLRRLGTQAEMGALIALLASQQAMPMTAQFIAFGGGCYA